MAKWCGNIGFTVTGEVEPGIWVDNEIVVRQYFGDIVRDTRRLQNSNSINDNIHISNQLSIIADPYANQNFHSIKYAEYMGTKWKVSDVEVQYPRLILSLGDVWNG